jgi:hypothetical protein
MKHHVRQLAFFTAALGITVAVACGDDDEPSGPQVVRTNFTATLNGANERPNPVTTTATGNAIVTVFGTDSVTYRVQVASIDSVTASHIHAGEATCVCPVMFGFAAFPTPASISALTTLREGTIIRTSTFNNPYTFDSLLTRLNAGTAYVNVHTRRNPIGEIRGPLIKQ